MSNVRMPAVASLFYPGDSAYLKHNVIDFLNNAEDKHISPRAIIAPHAGYIYSGEIAATAYKQLEHLKIKRVVLLGPSHRVPFRGIALSHAEFFHTPLGDIPLDTELIEKLSALPQVQFLDAAHKDEHSLEVHLPFLQVVLEEFTLVPMVIGECEPELIENIFKMLWDDDSTFFIVSSDLSHYHTYEEACAIDSRTTSAIENLHFEDINYQNACGCNPIKGLLKFARANELKAKTLDMRNSGDTAGTKDKVVGYGAYAILEE